MAVIRLMRSPFAALGRWWDLRCVHARIRWAEGDLEWLRRHRERDLQVEAALKNHLAELRVEKALLDR